MPPKSKSKKKSAPAKKTQTASQYATRSSFRKSATVMSSPLVFDSDDDADHDTDPQLDFITETQEARTPVPLPIIHQDQEENNSGESQAGNSAESQAGNSAESQAGNSAESQAENSRESQHHDSAESQNGGFTESQIVGSGESQTVGSGESQTVGSAESQSTESESQLTQSNSSLWSTRTVERKKRKAATPQDTNIKKRSRAFKSEDFGESAKLMEMARNDVRKLHLTVSPLNEENIVNDAITKVVRQCAEKLEKDTPENCMDSNMSKTVDQNSFPNLRTLLMRGVARIYLQVGCKQLCKPDCWQNLRMVLRRTRFRHGEEAAREGADKELRLPQRRSRRLHVVGALRSDQDPGFLHNVAVSTFCQRLGWDRRKHRDLHGDCIVSCLDGILHRIKS